MERSREYFIEKTNDLKSELKESIKSCLWEILGKDNCHFNVDETNCIEFESNVTALEEIGEISHIDVDDSVVIFPLRSDLEPIDLDVIENIHDLMLLHYISLNDVAVEC